jgi:16S rRNA (guanine966-N2)-methyltransferase
LLPTNVTRRIVADPQGIPDNCEQRQRDMRIIAGHLRGRRLKAPPGNATRPTSDRAREGIFSILGSLEGFRVLDLYAGTGALGIEAISRGAAHAVFVESGHRAQSCLLENISTLSLSQRTSVLRCPVERAGSDLFTLAPFDVIFCDPPWSNAHAIWQLLDKMKAANWLSSGGRLVLEHPASGNRAAPPISNLDFVCTRAWGDSAVTILQRPTTVQQP